MPLFMSFWTSFWNEGTWNEKTFDCPYPVDQGMERMSARTLFHTQTCCDTPISPQVELDSSCGRAQTSFGICRSPPRWSPEQTCGNTDAQLTDCNASRVTVCNSKPLASLGPPSSSSLIGAAAIKARRMSPEGLPFKAAQIPEQHVQHFAKQP